MPGDLALLLGAPALVAAGRGRCRRWPTGCLLAEVARVHPGYFAPVAETPGFGEALFRLVRELRGAGYDLSNLGPCSTVRPTRPRRRRSLAEILAEFEARRARFYGPDDALLAAEPERLDGLGLLVWGVLDLPPALERLAASRSPQRMPVDVFVAGRAGDRGRPARRRSAGGSSPRARRRSDTRGHGAGRVRRSTASARRCSRRPEARAIAPRRNAAPGVGAGPVARGAGGRAGVPSSGRGRGVRFWEMAVAYRHGEAYRPLVEAVFIEAGIPVYLHEGSPLAERPVGRQTLALLDLYERTSRASR